MPTLKIGDSLNLSGSQLVLGPQSLFAMDWRTRANAGAPKAMTSATRWSPGLDSGWSTNADGTGPVNLSEINPGQEDEYYVTYEGLQSLGPAFFPVTSDGPSGPLRIRPRLATSAERARLDTRADLGTHNWLSGSMTTIPEGISPPFYWEAEYTLPVNVDGTYKGLWPALWGVSARGGWPPEIDTMEGMGGPISASLHTKDKGWAARCQAYFDSIGKHIDWIGGDGTGDGAASMWVTTSADMQGKHRYGTLLLADGLYHFIDRKCVVIYPCPSDMDANSSFAMLIDFAIGKPGSGVGAPPPGATSVGELVVSDLNAWKMPAVYGQGGATGPTGSTGTTGPTGGQTGVTGATGTVPTTTLTVTAVPPTVAGPITLSGTAGTAWLNVGLFAPGWVNVGTDVKPVGGKWTMAVDTSKLKLGPNTLTIVGFSVAAGQPGGTSKSVPLTLNVVTPLTPIAAALAVLTADLANATPKTKADLAALARLLVGK